MEQQQNIPEFMAKYHAGSAYEAHAQLEHLARQYTDERATYLQTTFVEKQKFQQDWNKLTGQRRELTPDEALKPMQDRYQEKAKEIALAHGYQETQEKEAQATQSSEKQTQARREDFLQQVQAQRHQQQPSQQQKEEPAKPSQQQTDRERFLATLGAMKQEQQHISHRPTM